MGYDFCFDMYPGLTKSDSDTERWASFINTTCLRYIDGDGNEDPNVTVKTGSKGTFIEFMVGEHPKLPYDGTKFLRFSSKISTPRTQKAEPYIREVMEIAKKQFGNRIKCWHELFEVYGYYTWAEVAEREKSFLD